MQQPALWIEVRNTSNRPQDVIVDEIQADQATNAGAQPLKVYTFEELVAEHEAKQAARTILTVGLAAANSWTASQRHSLKSPGRAAAENQGAFDALEALDDAERARLEATILKDTTVRPGEKISGFLYLDPPADEGGAKKFYTLHMNVGSDRHDIMITQGRGASPGIEAMAQAPGGNPDLWQEWNALDRPIYAYAEPEQRVICTEPSGEVSLYSTLMCKPGAKTPVRVRQAQTQ